MNPINQVKEWFRQLAPRERVLVTIAGGLVIVTLIVTLGIRPIVNQTSRGQERVDDKQRLLTEITEIAQRLGPQTGGRQTATGQNLQSMVVLVDRTTRETGLAAYLKRNQPDGASSIRLRFENAPFDILMDWLVLVEIQYGMSTTSANIDRSAAPGRVNCNLTLDRAGA